MDRVDPTAAIAGSTAAHSPVLADVALRVPLKRVVVHASLLRED
ncbi:hypothetical protein [Methanopyrus kandleri]